jgi:hypothetical protein
MGAAYFIPAIREIIKAKSLNDKIDPSPKLSRNWRRVYSGQIRAG